jgi:2-phospho-L-lactate/phosphoenolpyruvate guanylyltransferase
MTSQHRGTGLAVIIPVKAFAAAKARLASVLLPSERAALARWTASRVIAAARGLDTFVACDDPEVAEWATAEGAQVVWGAGLGLNGAVDAAVAAVSELGYQRVLISHGDLPLARDYCGLVAEMDPRSVLLVPDRFKDGTNLVIRPTDIHLPACYGGGSFRAHLGLALATQRPVTVRMDLHLGLDLDTVAELNHPLIRAVLTDDTSQTGPITRYERR